MEGNTENQLFIMTNSRKKHFKNIKKIVVKVGTSTLTHPTGLLDLNRMESIVRQLVNIHNQDIQVVLVSSGAIGAGMGKLGLKKRPKTIPEKQSIAAVGQGILLHMYEKLFSEYGKTIAQILLTKDDIDHQTRFFNARNTCLTLIDKHVIPIVNENDAVAVDEIKVGDNDTLSALVAKLIGADLLIILSDIDGLYDCNPKEYDGACLIHYVDKITPQLEAMAGNPGSILGTGGMITKINAAKIATSAGASMIIANGSIYNVINSILEGEEIGTLFDADCKILK